MNRNQGKTTDRTNRRALLGLLGVAGALGATIAYFVTDASPAAAVARGELTPRAAAVAVDAAPVGAVAAPAETPALLAEPVVTPKVAPAPPKATNAPVAVDAANPWPTAVAAPAAVAAAPVLGAVRADDDVKIERAALITEGLDDGKLGLAMNKSTVLSTRAAYKRVSVGSADIADVNAIGPNNILVTAKKPGTTQLIVWDDDDRSQVVDLAVNVDLNAVKDQFKQMFPGSKIDVAMANGAIILRGQVPNLLVAEQAVMLANPYAPKVLNFLEVAGGQQVMLQVRFAEVSRSATNQLGVNFGTTDGRTFQGSNVGSVSPLGIENGSTAGGAILGIPSPNPSVTLFGTGAVGNSAFAYYVTALRQNNLLRLLAEPNLVAISGQEASFLAGGEFPIPVTQGSGAGSGGGAAISIEYRSFGVKLNFTPIVLGDGRIRLKVAPEVSDLDFTTAVRFNGFVVPGLSQRKLQTVVELHEGQTMALAGLLNNNVTSSKDVTPLLGDLPVVGALFRSVRYQRKETELVVIVTPRLVEGMNPAQVPTLPGEKWRHPTEGDLFWSRDLGGPSGDPKRAAAATPANANGPAPRFKGEFGYTPASAEE